MTTDDEKKIDRAAKFFEVAKAIRETDAGEAGTLAYVARVLTQVTLPHSAPKSSYFERTNGNVVLSMLAPPTVGLPFGTYPRLILAWVATEAVRSNSPVLELGDSLSAFMRELDLVPTGGRWGSVTRLRGQLGRLLKTTISWTEFQKGSKQLTNIAPFYKARFWWDPKDPSQTDFWASTLELQHDFYAALRERPVPVDMRALKILAHHGRSPLALDIYTWLTYRMSYLEDSTTIPWASLAAQFGGDYKRTRSFKEKFVMRLREVLELYPAARVRPGSRGLMLEPSPTHVPKLVKPKLKALPPPEPPRETR